MGYRGGAHAFLEPSDDAQRLSGRRIKLPTMVVPSTGLLGSLSGGESEGMTDGKSAKTAKGSAARSKRGASSLAGQGREGDSNSGERVKGTRRQAPSLSHADAPELAEKLPLRTPLYHAQHSDRYARQYLIREYEEVHDCRLAVMIDVIFPPSVTYLEELLHGADPSQDLHLMLDSPGGDGETAIRLVRAAQARCRELTIIVPNQAKSAGTILVIGAHRILMGPTSDLGPVDPQFPHPDRRGLYAAKDLIAAVDSAEAAIAENPDSYPLHASLLADVTAVMVQQARSALGRTDDLVKEALASNPDRTADEVKKIARSLKKTLIDLPRDHGAVFGPADAANVGLPVVAADPAGEQWGQIWQLWTKYFALECYVYEGRIASQVTSKSGAYA